MKHLGKGATIGVGVQIGGPRYVSIGENTWIDDYVILLAGAPSKDRTYINRKANSAFSWEEGELRIGANCHIAQHVTLQAHGGLTIGEACGVASGARIYTLSHHYKDLSGLAPAGSVFKFTPRARAEEQALICAPVVMEDHTAVGLNSVVLPGATIRKGSWVGVLSCVIGEIEANVVASGNPAKTIRVIRND